MAQSYPAEIRLTEEEAVALDEACAIWGLAGGDGRSRFIQHCLRYGLLSLLDAGVRDISEAVEPEFVRHYREMEARLSRDIHRYQPTVKAGAGVSPDAPRCPRCESLHGGSLQPLREVLGLRSAPPVPRYPGYLTIKTRGEPQLTPLTKPAPEGLAGSIYRMVK
jgi:hypothetical protein